MACRVGGLGPARARVGGAPELGRVVAGAVEGPAALRAVQRPVGAEPVDPDVPGRARQQPGLDLHCGHRAPPRPQMTGLGARLRAVLPHPPVAVVVAQRQHAVGGGLFEAPAAGRDAEAEGRGVGELGVLLGAVPHGRCVLAAGEGHHMAGRALTADQHPGLRLHRHRIRVGQRLLLRAPERVALLEGERQEELQGPIGGSGRVVLLGHVEIRVAVADGQQTRVVGDRLSCPPAQVAQGEALDLPPGQGLDVRVGECSPERTLGEPVGEAAAERQGRAVVREPVREVAGEQGRTFPELACELRCAVLGEAAVHQAVEVQCEGDVVVAPGRRSVGVPAVAQVEAVQTLQRAPLGAGVVVR
ncbi:hypothetical protein DSC45_21595 [Streptomyces sp. YIM 130001]|nr:hypothetical protein DSC45_21595 [Streptomyces sp. YIM 130001]